MPAYWLRRPELRREPRTVAAFDLLLDQALTRGPEQPIRCAATGFPGSRQPERTTRSPPTGFNIAVGLERGAEPFRKQLRFRDGWEMATTSVLGPVDDIEVPLGKFARGLGERDYLA